jgi:hypothetical protein
MFITDKKVCTLEFGVGVRYTICLTDESDENGYEVSVKSVISDMKKYPWLTGITIMGKEPYNRQGPCLELLRNLPSHMDITIITKASFDYIKTTNLYKEFPGAIILLESDVDFFRQNIINNKEEV